ncbi:putative lipid II flippase FtsW [Candidatus Berkelbacteria bacterium]|nr:putative lipid II flippase FtsW [Candidatus Berkelbacteria bacterium]
MALDKYRFRHRPDYMLIFLVLALCLIGLIAISSASVVISFEHFGRNYVYLSRQAAALAVGVLAWLLFQAIDYRFWKKIAPFLLFLTFGLLFLVFLPVIGHGFKGATRWLDLGFVTIQPSEIVKLTFILYLAAWLEARQNHLLELKVISTLGLLIALVAGLIILQPDMGTMVLVVLVAALMIFLAGADIYHFSLASILALFLFFVLIKIAPYRLERLLTFFNPSESLGSAYHINQSLLAVGNAGIFGLGFGNSRQKYLYLPQPQTDSIFAIIAEELGFLRASAIILLFLVLGIRLINLAKKAPDNFARLVVLGVTAWILVQVLINLGAMLGLLPLTGVTLPFISFGGTSLVVLLAAMGILTNISKQVK